LLRHLFGRCNRNRRTWWSCSAATDARSSPRGSLLIPFIESVHAKVNMHAQVAKAITGVGCGPHQSRAKPYLSSLPTTQLNAASVTI
jgi:hypothetical protein